LQLIIIIIIIMMEESDYLEKRVNVNKTTHHNYPQDAKFQCLEQLRNTN